MRIERGLHELYADDPERADALVFGRRGVLRGASLLAMSAALGGVAIPFARFMPEGYLPVALAGEAKAVFPGKHPGLVLLSDKPLVAETPAHLLDDPVTPTDRLFIRNNGGIPEAPADPDAWKIRIDGEVHNPLELTVGELKRRFPRVEGVFTLECAGNGRSQFVPQARGNPWTTGGVGCPRWAGARLKDVLEAAGLKSTAVYTVHYGADPHLSGDPTKVTLSRGVRLAKALDEYSILAYEMNGEPLPLLHGGPVRLVFPGWAGSACHKWLTRIWIRDREHDGPGMTGTTYRVPVAPIVPGSESKGEGFRVFEVMPVRSIVTDPPDGTRLPKGTREFRARGHAWAGELEIKEVWTSIDFGATWQRAELDPPVNRHAWQRWRQTVKLPTHGYYELWVRAVDANGVSQPFMAGNWNPQGYGANAYHRIAILVEA
ncbi:MAG: sulfite oxidase [Geminicoccaceae bacterium]|nr:sulfite oxidase [Geminicoccaceae bacterium]